MTTINTHTHRFGGGRECVCGYRFSEPTTRNEAAERLRKRFLHEPVSHHAMELLDEALNYERERLQSNVRLVLIRHHVSDEDIATCDVCTALRRAILDEEAAR